MFCLCDFQTDALKCVAQASKNRSLADFEKVRISLDLISSDFITPFIRAPFILVFRDGCLGLFWCVVEFSGTSN